MTKEKKTHVSKREYVKKSSRYKLLGSDFSVEWICLWKKMTLNKNIRITMLKIKFNHRMIFIKNFQVWGKKKCSSNWRVTFSLKRFISRIISPCQKRRSKGKIPTKWIANLKAHVYTTEKVNLYFSPKCHFQRFRIKSNQFNRQQTNVDFEVIPLWH